MVVVDQSDACLQSLLSSWVSKTPELTPRFTLLVSLRSQV